MLLKLFVINSHEQIVFPGNFFPKLDFSAFKSLKQFAAVIRRDFGEKAPTESEIVERVPAMVNQRFGRIINIRSVVGQMGAFGQANY